MDTNNSQKPHNKKTISQNSIGIIICALCVTLTVGINLLVNELPVESTKLDTTEIGLHTLSDNTKELLNSITEDIYIYRVCQSGKEDATLTDMLERYASLCSYLNISTIDPAAYPNFEQQYTEESLSNNSIIVTSAKRSQIIDYANIATYTAFNGEDYLTSAIKYVTSESLPVLYALEGHGEKKADDSLVAAFNKAGIELKSVNLLSSGSIPEDTECIFVYAPETDLTAQEAAQLTEYLANNSKMLLITDYNSSELTNFTAVMKEYGVSTLDGVVMEGAADRCLSGYPYYILPYANEKSEITKQFNNNSSFVLMPLAQAIVKNSDIRDTVEITDLLTTSDLAYIIQDSSYEKVDDMPNGPYSLAVSIEEEYDGNDTKIVWITNSEFITSQSDQMVGGANSQFLTSAVNYLCGQDISSSVNGKSLSLGTLIVTTSQSRMWKIILTGIIPAIAAAFGIVVWYRRRNR